MNRTTVIALLALFGALGCKPHEPHRTIALLDVSGSIYPEEVDREFREVQELADGLGHGDQLIVIPITGNARNDTPGHILKLNAPAQRSPFDGDLVRFRHEADAQIVAMEEWARATPAKRTDIFGTLQIAQREAASEQARTKLVLMSDLLEDDGEVNFVTSPRLASPASAKSYAANEVLARGLLRSWANVQIMNLRSNEGGGLSLERSRAIDESWRMALRTTSLGRIEDDNAAKMR